MWNNILEETVYYIIDNPNWYNIVTTITNWITIIVSAAGLIGVICVYKQFKKDAQKDELNEEKEKEDKKRKEATQRAKPLFKIYDDNLDDVKEVLLKNSTYSWIGNIESYDDYALKDKYFICYQLPSNKFVTNAEIHYWRKLITEQKTALEDNTPNFLGTIAPNQGFIHPISKDNSLSYFIYLISYINELNEKSKFIIVAEINPNSKRVKKVFDILLKDKSNSDDIFKLDIYNEESWNNFKAALSEEIIHSLEDNKILGDEWDYISFTETAAENICSANSIKRKFHID